MKVKNLKYVKYLLISILLLILSFNFLLLNSSFNYINILKVNEIEITPNISAEIPYSSSWIVNSGFDSEDSWFKDLQGDTKDINADIKQGQANYIIIGDSAKIQIDNPLSDTDWTAFNNPKFPITPDSYGIDSSGCYVSHVWNENIDQTKNTPSMQWKRNITLPVNMSDYIITSASLEVIFNASVQALDHDGGGIEVPGDYTEGQNPPVDTQFGIGDFATFYTEVSDLNNSFSFRIASNKTTNLGQDDPEISTYPDTLLNVIPENILISYLTSSLQTDYFNFTITLGIDIYCEDNEYNVDIDRWNSLIIRSFNLSFTYEKKIDQYTTASWIQTGDSISNNTNIQVTNANLRFDYKVDQIWPYVSSPNSEIRVFVNNKQNKETIKLSSATTTYQRAKSGGFDITSLIAKGININLAIQVFIADTFILDQNITISIDNVYLEISLVLITEDIYKEPFMFRLLFIFSIVIALGLGGYLYAYQKFLKYPPPVRKTRRYRFSLKKKNPPNINIVSREIAFQSVYSGEIKGISGSLKVKAVEPKLLMKVKEGE